MILKIFILVLLVITSILLIMLLIGYHKAKHKDYNPSKNKEGSFEEIILHDSNCEESCEESCGECGDDSIKQELEPPVLLQDLESTIDEFKKKVLRLVPAENIKPKKKITKEAKQTTANKKTKASKKKTQIQKPETKNKTAKKNKNSKKTQLLLS